MASRRGPEHPRRAPSASIPRPRTPSWPYARSSASSAWTPARGRSSGTSAAEVDPRPRRRRSGAAWCGGASWSPSPASAPRASYRRFEASAPNELWQADCIDWAIATGSVRILSFVDDHSRVALRVKALAEATTDATWETFCEASARWGVPLGQLSDNGLNFSGRLRGFEVRFETELRAIGVVAKTSRPYHPQTCGKVERFQQTLKRWLRRQRLAADLAQLQEQLDRFVAYYNHERPHRGIARCTPAEHWAATPPAVNLGSALPSPTQASTVVVARNGTVGLGGRYCIGIGSEWRGRTAVVHHDDTHAAVFIDHKLVRALALDPTRRYQPTGRPPGRRPKA